MKNDMKVIGYKNDATFFLRDYFVVSPRNDWLIDEGSI